MPKLSPEQIGGYACAAGFSGDQLVNAIAVALAESSGETDAGASFTNDSNGGTGGLMQFNAAEWARYSGGASMSDPAAQMKAAYAYSQGGKNWDPWCTATPRMNNGHAGCGGAGGATADKYLDEAKRGAAAQAGGCQANADLTASGDNKDNPLASIPFKAFFDKFFAGAMVVGAIAAIGVALYFFMDNTEIGREIESGVKKAANTAASVAVAIPK